MIPFSLWTASLEFLQGIVFAGGKGTGGESNNAGFMVCPLTLITYVKLSKIHENYLTFILLINYEDING